MVTAKPRAKVYAHDGQTEATFWCRCGETPFASGLQPSGAKTRCLALRMCPVQPAPMRRAPEHLWSRRVTERLPALAGTLWLFLVQTDRLYKAAVGAGTPLSLWRGE